MDAEKHYQDEICLGKSWVVVAAPISWCLGSMGVNFSPATVLEMPNVMQPEELIIDGYQQTEVSMEDPQVSIGFNTKMIY